MAFKKKLIALTLVLTIVSGTTPTNAEIDFSKDEAKYQKLCNKRSSYNANKKTCQSFENYLKDQKSNSEKAAKNIQSEIKNIKGDITKLVETIRENAKVIEQKKQDITRTNKEITIAEEDIRNLEADIRNRLSLLQEVNGENFMIDFIMSSASIDDFLTKVDGINAINSSNNDAINDLNTLKSKLAKKKEELIADQKKLEEYEVQQNELLKEHRQKEAELFIKLEQQHKRNSVYNNKLKNININDLVSSVGRSGKLYNPVQRGTVTAIAWYYPASFGGGWHPGIDLANNQGTPIISPANGVVLLTGSDGSGYGNYMVTAHQVGNDTYTFLYGHLNRYANFGSSIKQGQTIAYMGTTGNSTGPHLHLEVMKHSNKSLANVINTYKANGDLYFGLGYASVGSCANVCRLKPHELFNLKYGQVY